MREVTGKRVTQVQSTTRVKIVRDLATSHEDEKSPSGSNLEQRRQFSMVRGATENGNNVQEFGIEGDLNQLLTTCD